MSIMLPIMAASTGVSPFIFLFAIFILAIFVGRSWSCVIAIEIHWFKNELHYTTN